MPVRLLIINSMKSGLRDGSIYDFMRKIASDGDEVVVRTTDGTTHIETMLHDAREFDTVIVAGGDSTISAVSYALRESRIPILPFPVGVGNLIAANLDEPEEPAALVNIVRDGFTQDYDLGELEFITDGVSQTRGFTVMSGAGFDARIMNVFEKQKGFIGPMAYLTSAIANPSPTVSHFTITLDDKVLEKDAIAVLIINFAKIYPAIPITHANDARDGLFEVAIIKAQSTLELFPAMVSAFLDRGGTFPGRADAMEVHLSRNVRIECDPPLDTQFDGELIGVLPSFSARLLPRAARYIVTKEEYDRRQQPAG